MTQPCMAAMGKPKRVFFIDVCKTCDRLAKWPFCEHRPEHIDYEAIGNPFAPRNLWYETIRVRET